MRCGTFDSVPENRANYCSSSFQRTIPTTTVNFVCYILPRFFAPNRDRPARRKNRKKRERRNRVVNTQRERERGEGIKRKDLLLSTRATHFIRRRQLFLFRAHVAILDSGPPRQGQCHCHSETVKVWSFCWLSCARASALPTRLARTYGARHTRRRFSRYRDSLVLNAAPLEATLHLTDDDATRLVRSLAR